MTASTHKNPGRLSDTGTPFEKMLLRSGKADAPPSFARERAMAALGLLESQPAGKTPNTASGLKLIRWVGHLIVYGVTAILSGALLLSDNTTHSNISGEHQYPIESAPTESPQKSIETPPATETEPDPEPETQPSPVLEQLPQAKETPSSKPAAPKPLHPKTPAAASLKEEIELIDTARNALRKDKNPKASLAALNKYRQRFPNGVLKPEAEALLREAKRSHSNPTP